VTATRVGLVAATAERVGNSGCRASVGRSRTATAGFGEALLFVNWHRVHAMFCGLMWVIAVVLAIVVLAHAALSADSAHHAVRIVR
jgi:hypothetical protein